MSAIKKILPFGREKLTLVPEKKGTQQLSRLRENETILTFLLTIKSLKAGDYFGVGESMKDLFMVTREKVFYYRDINLFVHLLSVDTFHIYSLGIKTASFQ